MESSGTSTNSSDSRPHRWADIFGTLIAVVTLLLPVMAIAHFSTSSVELISPPSTYPITKTQD